MDLLEAHDEHRAIRFREDGRADLDDVVRPNGEEESIECGVVELAQDDAVADMGSPSASLSGVMCAASKSSTWRSRQSAQRSA